MLQPKYTSANGSGALRCVAEGEAWLLDWRRGNTSPSFQQGVAIILGHTVFAARSGNGPEDGFAPPGIVVYERDATGELPARWYHPDLKGRLGEGRSLEGPSGGYVGTYRAEYASQDEAFEPLVKEIARQGTAYRFAWRTPQETVYIGIGVELGANLVAAWSTPRESLDVAIYHVSPETGDLVGKSVAYSDASGNAVVESWQSSR
jgi:hypothetical protein